MKFHYSEDFDINQRNTIRFSVAHWKGVEWILVIQADSNFNGKIVGKGGLSFGLYFGHIDRTNEKALLPISLIIQFEILEKSGKNPIVTKSFRHNKTFLLREFDDIGSNPFEYVYTNNEILKVRFVIEEEFRPESIKSHYNSKQVTKMVGIENLGATCYLNSLLQMLFHINAFRKAVYHIPFDDQVYSTSTTLTLQHIFKELQLSNKEVDTKDLLAAFGWTSQDAFAQQDAQEMMRVLLEKLEEKMKGTMVDGVITNLFCGKLRSYIKCINVEYESKREEDFYDIQLDVKGCHHIYESFDKYVEPEVLDGENQYDAGKEFGKQDAKKGMIFTKLPPVLTILLKRFDFDMIRMRFIKIHDSYAFPIRLNLNKYVLETDDINSSEVSNIYQLHSVLVHVVSFIIKLMLNIILNSLIPNP